MVKTTSLTLIILLLAPLIAVHAANPPKAIECDICVYGGTSGGVVAAVQAARMGKSVVIAEPARHLGGMTAGGLSAVDIGDPRSVGGIAREYFTKLAATGGTTLAWDKPFENKEGGPATGGAYAIEPHEAERVFNDLVREAGVKVYLQARLAKVKKSGARITEFVTEAGILFRGKMFIDATYEGDLMAKAGVSYTLVREGNVKYGETHNGIYYDENYQRGLLHFLATDARVPEKVRGDMKRYGLPKDEFTDNGGWPHQIYVREARRMVSDLVLTEHHTFGRKVATKSVSLGSYGTDTHEIRRLVQDGVVIREGKTAGGRDGFGPYQIGYDAIVPKRDECENLFVTFALSASHTAFSSIRMEPVFMVTSQSAATAAVMAIDDKVPVQQVDYAKLRARLLNDGQVLDGETPQASASKTPPTRSGKRACSE